MFQPAQALTANAIRPVYEAGLAAIGKGETAIDLSQVTAVDSSAVAALVGWQRAALQRGVAIAFTGLSASLQSLAALYGVADLLQPAAAVPAKRMDLPHH